ncbi:alkaline phosphatase family protein [Billgrantia endophytica]|uniref:Nucleotide pyrophosphatase n=1 Tax=Billgrantia endophytica TaxID=2033802 RepID=A0A2N7UAB9_9GAMM|nr:alkaline phosphatase family protein [Halomonas endophytica]PMR77396.1 nucleotide pyrophosphatase [Halomonas endophytica]
MRRVVAVILDGLRRDFVRPDTTPHLARFKERCQWFAAHRSMAPSVTRVCSSSFATGCLPMRHEVEGNTLALVEDGRFAVHDVGQPGFFAHKRRVTGRSLAAPTLAERLHNHGGAVLFSNVSPGAAYAHDPDGHGFVYHRAGSFGPGGKPVAPERALGIGPDITGDRIMAERFVAETLTAHEPAFALIWLGHPDTTQHAVPLGSPEHLAALKSADEHVALVIDAVDRLRAAGDDVLLLVGSDHGHQTVHSVVDVEAETAKLGYADAITANDLIIVPNGTSVLVYASEAGRPLVPQLTERLAAQPWVGEVLAGSALARIGQTERRGLALFLSLTADHEVNAFGVPGRSYAAKPRGGKADRLGCGQHGGLGTYEQSPVLAIEGSGFTAGAAVDHPSSLIDIAPTVLCHLDLPSNGMDGRSLQNPPAMELFR